MKRKEKVKKAKRRVLRKVRAYLRACMEGRFDDIRDLRADVLAAGAFLLAAERRK